MNKHAQLSSLFSGVRHLLYDAPVSRRWWLVCLLMRMRPASSWMELETWAL